MTLTTPWRFTIWQYSHLRFTDARTFIPALSQIFNDIILNFKKHPLLQPRRK